MKVKEKHSNIDKQNKIFIFVFLFIDGNKNVGIPRSVALLHGILPVSILQSLELCLINITTVRFATRATTLDILCWKIPPHPLLNVGNLIQSMGNYLCNNIELGERGEIFQHLCPRLSEKKNCVTGFIYRCE